jgi:hypothetical protein
MVLAVEKVLRLVSIKTITKAKDGEEKSYHFAKMADEETFDSVEFMLSRNQAVDLLIPKERYRVSLEIDGKFMSAHLIQETPAKLPKTKENS